MHSDADFVAAVAAAPNSALTRLVYADWLEERSDPRAELIRHEEQMREWAVFSDEYWQAKPRRAELRKQFDPAWVRAMGYGVSVPPLFRHGWPDDLRGRWRLIREMYELSTGHPMPDVGGQPQLIAQAETNLQDTLPESVAHFVAFARDRAAFDSLRRFAGLTDFSAQQDLEFIWLFETDGGGDYLCVRRADWHLPDPPVVHAPPIDGDPETGLVFDTPDAPPSPLGTLSEYILATILNAHGTGGEWGDRVPTGAVRERLTERFGPPVSVAFRNGVEEDVFETVDVLIRLEDEGDGSAFLRVSVRPGGVAAVRDLLDFRPTAAGYRGGAFLPTSPDIPDGYWSGRITNEEIASEARFRGSSTQAQLTGDQIPAMQRWLRLSAEYGDPEAAFLLYQLHKKKRIHLRTPEYIAYFRQSLATNRPSHWIDYGLFRMRDQIEAPDYPEALIWLRKAFDAGRWDAARHIGACRTLELGGVRDGVELARSLAADGSAESLHDLAALLWDGYGNLPADRARAKQLLARIGTEKPTTRDPSDAPQPDNRRPATN